MSEFTHYTGCGRKDPLNCSACALTTGGEEGPNYAGWPLVYLIHGRTIPKVWDGALKRELERTDNPAYVQNLKQQLEKKGYAI
jgi:hypothetical protein